MSDSTKSKNVAHSMYTNGIDKMKSNLEKDKEKIGVFDVNVNTTTPNTNCSIISAEFDKIKSSYSTIIAPPKSFDDDNSLVEPTKNINEFIKKCLNSTKTIIDQLIRIERMFITYINNSIEYIIYNETNYELEYMNIIVDILEHFTLTYDSNRTYTDKAVLNKDYDKILDDNNYVRFCDHLKYYYNEILLLIKGFNESIKTGENTTDNDKLKDIYTKASKIIDECNNNILKTIERVITSISNNYVNKLNSIDTIYVNLQDENIFYCPTYLNKNFTVDLENKEVEESIDIMVNYYSVVNKKINKQLRNDITIDNFNTIKYDLYGLIFYRKMCKLSPYRDTELMGTKIIPNLSTIQTHPFDNKNICFCCALPVDYQEMIQKLNFDYKVDIREAYIKTANVMYYIKTIIDNLLNEEKSIQIRNERICKFYDSDFTGNCSYDKVNFKLILDKYNTIVSRDISSYHNYIFQNTSDKNKITESSLNKFSDNNLSVGNMMRSSKILHNTVVNSHSFDELINAIDPKKGSWVITFIIGLIIGILSVVGSIIFVLAKNGTEVSTENELKLKKKKIKIWFIVCLIGLILSVLIITFSLFVLFKVSKNSPANKIRLEILFTAIFIIITFGYLIFFILYYLNDKVKIKLVVKEPETPAQTPGQPTGTPGQTN